MISIISDISAAARSGEVPPGLVLHADPRPLPPVRFVAKDGSIGSLSDFRGQTVLLNIWATWCPPCREEMPTLDRLQSRLGGEGFQVVALSIDRAGMSVVETFFRDAKIQYLTPYLDNSGGASRALGVTGLPTTLLIDAAGREVGRLVGPAQWDDPAMISYFERYRK